MIEYSPIEDKKLFNLILGRTGGKTSMKIIDEILIKPRNANQLAKKLELDYKTIIYHMNVLCNHEYVIKVKLDSYTWYQPSEKLIKNLKEYYLIKERYIE